ncbi:MAG: branched-chain amino acid ABC transporter permease [Candidatus Rokubacteria bacterium 13_1_40CM_68_15]|nr:MAG: branched-chain amino acid ABC transporter permease [Candidatus Rokubacteria bacterium 13_1_40CM_68_15]
MVGGLYALIALGLTLIFGVMKIINFAHGSLMMLAMYATFWLATTFHLDPYLSLAVTVPAAFVFGYAVQRGVIAPVLNAPEHNQLLMTLGLALVLDNLALVVFKADPRTLLTAYSQSTLPIGPLRLNLPRLLAFAGAVVITALLAVVLKTTDIGKALRAAAEERDGAALVGIPVPRVYAVAFGLGTACVAAAGTMAVPFFYVSPDVGNVFVITAFVVVVLGGLGSFPGALLGGLLVGVVESLGGLYLHGSLAQIAIFALFILILLVRPDGILGTPHAA